MTIRRVLALLIPGICLGSLLLVQADAQGISGGGGSSGGGGVVDATAFTFGTSQQGPIGGVFQTTANSNPLTTGQVGVVQLTANRAMHINLRSAAGVEQGTAAAPVQVSLANTAVNGTPIAVSLGPNQSMNEAQINGVAPLMGNGISGTGSQRVNIASDNTPFSVNAVQSGAWTLAANQSMNEALINGVVPLMGNGVAGTGAQRVTIASDNTAFTVNAAQSGTWNVTNVSGTVSLPTGAATSALQTTGNTSLATIAANTGGPIPAGTAAIGSTSQTNGDPCSSIAHAFTPINIVTAANTKIVTGTSAKKTYICALFLFAGAADNVAIVEGSGTNCATSPLALAGGNTAATGFILPVGAGFVLGHGTNAMAATTVNANDVCLITSAAAQLSGVAVTVQN